MLREPVPCLCNVCMRAWRTHLIELSVADVHKMSDALGGIARLAHGHALRVHQEASARRRGAAVQRAPRGPAGCRKAAIGHGAGRPLERFERLTDATCEVLRAIVVIRSTGSRQTIAIDLARELDFKRGPPSRAFGGFREQVGVKLATAAQQAVRDKEHKHCDCHERRQQQEKAGLCFQSM